MKQSLNDRPGCLALFALPFALVGVAMGVWAGSDLLEWRRMRAWKPADCVILHTGLEASRGSDSTTWRVTARYRYEIDGRVFVNDRVAITVGSDNIGNFHQALYKRLKGHQSRGTPAVCWVNPLDPRDAVLHREMRWEMFLIKLAFVLTFGGLGFGLMIYSLRRVRLAREAVKENPVPEPVQISSTTFQGWTLLVMSLAFLGLSAGVFLPILEEIRAGNYPALLFFLFPLAGIGLLVAALVHFLRRRRFGRSRLRILSPPAAAGEILRGEVRIAKSLHTEFQVTLMAVMAGNQNNSSSQPLWKAAQTCRALPYGAFSVVDFTFQLPISLDVPDFSNVPTALRSVFQRLIKGPLPIAWVLDIAATFPGVDYHESFRLPGEAVKMDTIHAFEPDAMGGAS